MNFKLFYIFFQCAQLLLDFLMFMFFAEFPFHFQATLPTEAANSPSNPATSSTVRSFRSNQIEKFPSEEIFLLSPLLLLLLLLMLTTVLSLVCMLLNLSQSLISTFRLNWFHGSEWKSSSSVGWGSWEREEKICLTFCIFPRVCSVLRWHNQNENATMVRWKTAKFHVKWEKESIEGRRRKIFHDDIPGETWLLSIEFLVF